MIERPKIHWHIFPETIVFQNRWELLLLFALFGLSWVLASSIKETFLGWHGSFVSKKCKKAWRAAPLYIFWTVWNERNKIAFKDDELSFQRLKNSFVCILWSWTKMFVEDGPLTLVSFFDGLATCWWFLSRFIKKKTSLFLFYFFHFILKSYRIFILKSYTLPQVGE